MRARVSNKKKRTETVNDQKLPFPLHDDISGTENRIVINEKAF